MFVLCPESKRQPHLGFYETRRVEKHDALLFFVSLFESLILALKDIKSEGNVENTGLTNNLKLALFVSGIDYYLTRHGAGILAVTPLLSGELQAKNTDLSAAIADINAVKQAIQNDCRNLNKSFAKIFSKV